MIGARKNNRLLAINDEPHTEANYTVQAMSRFFPFGSNNSGGNVVIILDTYLDESGTHDESPVTVVAGFAAIQPDWEAFDGPWKAFLDKWGIDHFHMTDFENRQGGYADWSYEQRHKRLNALLSLITEHVRVAVWAAVPKDVYERVLSDSLKERINPYQVAAISCFTRLNGILRHEFSDRDVRAAYVYEDIAKGAGAVCDAYTSIKKVPGLADDLHMLSFSYQPKKMFTPLQSADILAYEVWKDLSNQLSPNPMERRYPIKQLEQSIDIRASLFSDTELQILVPLLNQVFL